MFSLTKDEKICILSLFVIILFGYFIQITFKKYPHLFHHVNFLDSEDFYPKLDVNTSTKDDLVRIPGIGAYTADKIIAYRNDNPIRSIEDINNISGISLNRFKKLKKYLKVSQ